MREAVQEGTGEAFVAAEELGPLGEGEVGGDQHAHLLVAPAEEGEEVFAPRLAEGEVAQLVHDDQVTP